MDTSEVRKGVSPPPENSVDEVVFDYFVLNMSRLSLVSWKIPYTQESDDGIEVHPVGTQVDLHPLLGGDTRLGKILGSRRYSTLVPRRSASGDEANLANLSALTFSSLRI